MRRLLRPLRFLHGPSLTFHRALGAGMGLRSALGCFTFAGRPGPAKPARSRNGSYRSAVIVPYNFTNFSTQDMTTLIEENCL